MKPFFGGARKDLIPLCNELATAKCSSTGIQTFVEPHIEIDALATSIAP